ncbi:MAG: DUF971 domain-containing protein [Proteobacteria bacterium]|nr:DUF971 domain-containing protein [Pseudomonadota bacterium]MDE3209000.1 DUF971 domain-containing protein [Pseudomonadota bacterium]
MTGQNQPSPRPIEIRLKRKSRLLELEFDDGKAFSLSCEFLRVYSPSAEVRGHGQGQEVLQTGKKNVNIERIEPVGQYAVRLVFTDGHDSGLYSWDYLYGLGIRQNELWQAYLHRLEAAGASREGGHSVFTLHPTGGHSH